MPKKAFFFCLDAAKDYLQVSPVPYAKNIKDKDTQLQDFLVIIEIHNTNTQPP